MIIDDNHPDFYDLKNAIPKLMKLLMKKEFYFYGTFNNLFKIDDMVLEAIEDPDDGYRSHLGAICHYASKKDIVYQFHKRPLARVESKCGNMFNTITDKMRKTDLCQYIDAEKFVILLSHTDETEAKAAIIKFLDHLQEDCRNAIYVGYSTLQSGDMTSRSIIQRANAALKSALKTVNKNIVKV